MVTATRSSNDRNGAPWLPLGTALLFDWKLLGAKPSPRGAMAWAAAVHGESVILRTWHDETTAYYEFFFLAHPDLTGTFAVVITRPAANRLRLEIAVEAGARLAVRDTHEFHEHAQTRLYGATARTVEITRGDLAAESLGALGPAEAEIFEYAPETALFTACGTWIHGVLEAVRAEILDGESVADEPDLAEVKPVGPRRDRATIEGPSPRADDSHAVAPRRDRATIEGPSLAPEPAFDKPRTRHDDGAARPRPAAKPVTARLSATTPDGDSWELDGEEIFVGRSKQCGIVLKSQRVSRKHASITREQDGDYINDLGAANGIWVGTEKIDRERIEDGAEYIIGDILVTFHYG